MEAKRPRRGSARLLVRVACAWLWLFVGNGSAIKPQLVIRDLAGNEITSCASGAPVLWDASGSTELAVYDPKTFPSEGGVMARSLTVAVLCDGDTMAVKTLPVPPPVADLVLEGNGPFRAGVHSVIVAARDIAYLYGQGGGDNLVKGDPVISVPKPLTVKACRVPREGVGEKFWCNFVAEPSVGSSFEWEFGDGSPKEYGWYVTHEYDLGPDLEEQQYAAQVTISGGAGGTETVLLPVVQRRYPERVDVGPGPCTFAQGMLEDFKVFVDFADPAIPAGRYEDLRRGALFGVMMLATMVPRMSARLVSNQEDADLNVQIDNYPDAGWTGKAGLNPMQVNTFGHGNLWGFDEFTKVSRDEAYRSYVPATNVPQPWRENGAWETLVTNERPEPYGADLALNVFHELVHVMGKGGHVKAVEQDWLEWFNGGTFGSLVWNNQRRPNIFVASGTYNEVTKVVTPATWFPAFNKTTWLNYTHMIGVPYSPSHLLELFPGIPWNTPWCYNRRVVWAQDCAAILSCTCLDQIKEGVRLYPKAINAQRFTLETRGGKVETLELSADKPVLGWDEVIEMMQLTREGAQADPYFITGIELRTHASVGLRSEALSREKRGVR